MSDQAQSVARLIDETFMRELARAIKAHTLPLHERIKALEARAIPEYKGVYYDGAVYCEANIVTHKGGLWIALCATTSRPGSDDWRLIVKRGEAER